MLASMNQNTSSEAKFGGSIKVFEGHTNVLTGGFEFILDELPDKGNVLPIATPVYADEETRVIRPTYTFALAEAAEETAVEYKIKKGPEGSRIKVGTILMVAPASVSDKGTGVKVSAVDTTNAAYDVITVSATLGVKEVGAVLIEADQEGAEATVKVVPNALLDRDVRKLPDATQVNATAVFFSDMPVLERRIPPIPDCLKKALLESGCYLRFSKRK